MGGGGRKYQICIIVNMILEFALNLEYTQSVNVDRIVVYRVFSSVGFRTDSHT